MENNTVYCMISSCHKKKEFVSIKELNATWQNPILEFVTLKKASLPKMLKIKAIRENKELDVKLYLMKNHFYHSEEISDIGIFYFEVINENFFYYKKGEKKLLSLLSPVNNDRFEWACKEHRFFFVGESEV